MLHTNGPWENQNGLLFNRYAKTFVQPYEMALGIGDNVVLKCGNADMVTSYMQTFYQRIVSMMPFDPPEIIIIHFNNYQFLSADDICTLANYMLNHLTIKQIQTLIATEPKELKAKIQKLQSFGF